MYEYIDIMTAFCYNKSSFPKEAVLTSMKGVDRMPAPILWIAAGTIIGFVGRVIVLSDREKNKK